MLKNCKIICLALAVCLLIGINSVYASEPFGVLNISIEDASAEEGEEFCAEIRLSSNPGVGFVGLCIRYDASEMSFIRYENNADCLKTSQYTNTVSEYLNGEINIICCDSENCTEEDVNLGKLYFKQNADALVNNMQIMAGVLNDNPENVLQICNDGSYASIPYSFSESTVTVNHPANVRITELSAGHSVISVYDRNGRMIYIGYKCIEADGIYRLSFPEQYVSGNLKIVNYNSSYIPY